MEKVFNAYARRIRALRGNMSLEELSELSGIKIATLRSYVEGRRVPSLAPLKKLAQAFKVSVESLMEEDGDTTRAGWLVRLPHAEDIPIFGYVVGAGIWREKDAMNENTPALKSYLTPDSRYPIAAQFDLRVEGESANLAIGTDRYVRCVSISKAKIDSIPNGWRVIIVRTNESGLLETSLRIYSVVDGYIELRPRSSDPRWQQDPIKIKVGEDHPTVKIEAVVLYGYTPGESMAADANAQPTVASSTAR